MTKENQKSKPGLRQWFWCIAACIACVAFCFWTGYWGVLILIPVFIDIYITKFIPWGGWRNVKNPILRKVLDWVDAIVFALVGVWVITTFFFQNYQIPTSSLEKSLLVGDFLCVNKLAYGGRSPMTPFSLPLVQHTIPFLNIKSYLDKPQVEYKRFAGWRSIERNDIVVFNYPAGDTVSTKIQNPDYYMLCYQTGRENVWKDKNTFGDIVYRPVDKRDSFVKRCLGLPGETIELKNDIVYIDGKAQESPENMQLMYVVQTDGTAIAPGVFDELGISEEDKSRMSMADPRNILGMDSLRITSLGFKIKNASAGLLYFNVNMTKQMVEQLKQKPFVLTVMKLNEYQNRAGYKRDFKSEPFYPITYEREAGYGDYPATWIPKKGETITFDSNVDYKVAAYERCIKNYEHNDFDYRNGKVYINGQQANSYTFKYDYYFMMGDNRDCSSDSRSWGFVPEDHVVGQPMVVWLSLDKDKSGFSKIRWDRLFTKANKK